MRSTLVLCALAAACSTATAAERWTVTEGGRGEWRGVWELRPSRGDFKLELRNGNTFLTADGFYIRSGNNVSIVRSKTSDGNDCHYAGTIAGNTVSGVSYCTSGGPYRWTATISD
jgi:hypothetical protein